MPYREKETEKVYFKIAEVAEMIDAPTYTLRHWEKEFDWLSPKKNKTGDRVYTKVDIRIVIDINYLVRVMGLTHFGVNLAYKYDYIDELKQLHANKLRNGEKDPKHLRGYTKSA